MLNEALTEVNIRGRKRSIISVIDFIVLERVSCDTFVVGLCLRLDRMLCSSRALFCTRI
jgi:hypothetical protein